MHWNQLHSKIEELVQQSIICCKRVMLIKLFHHVKALKSCLLHLQYYKQQEKQCFYSDINLQVYSIKNHTHFNSSVLVMTSTKRQNHVYHFCYFFQVIKTKGPHSLTTVMWFGIEQQIQISTIILWLWVS